jgi:hypothetical protein
MHKLKLAPRQLRADVRRPKFPDADGHWRFHIQKISNGRIGYLEDRYFEIRG